MIIARPPAILAHYQAKWILISPATPTPLNPLRPLKFLSFDENLWSSRIIRLLKGREERYAINWQPKGMQQEMCVWQKRKLKIYLWHFFGRYRKNGRAFKLETGEKISILCISFMCVKFM